MTYFSSIREKSSQSFDSLKTLRDEKNRQVCLMSYRGEN